MAPKTREQVLLDLSSLDYALCVDVSRWERAFTRIADALEATVISRHTHVFHAPAPPGLTAYFLLDASHLSVHTYAEEGRAAVDIFACTDTSLEGTVGQLLALVNVPRDNVVMHLTLRRFTSGDQG
jgi:S-adenosylmethionine decarboxylase